MDGGERSGMVDITARGGKREKRTSLARNIVFGMEETP
jgi:hypothetical protein